MTCRGASGASLTALLVAAMTACTTVPDDGAGGAGTTASTTMVTSSSSSVSTTSSSSVSTTSASSAVSSGAGGTGGAGAACDPTKPFGTPTVHPFENLNTSAPDSHPFLLDDELTVYFGTRAPNSEGGMSYQIFVATRASTTEAFSAGTSIPGAVNTPQNSNEAHGPVLDPSATTLYFTKAEAGVTSGYKIWASKRAAPDAPWGTPGQVANVNDNVGGISSVGSLFAGELWLAQAPDGIQNTIYRAPQSGTGFASPIALPELGNATNPLLSGSGLRIYFSRQASNTSHVWTATRTSPTGQFVDLQEVPEVNGPTRDLASWISPDECRLYISSVRPGGKGGLDLYMATRPK